MEKLIAVVGKPAYGRATVSRGSDWLRIVVPGIGFSWFHAMGVAFFIYWIILSINLAFFLGDFFLFFAGLMFSVFGVFGLCWTLYSMYGREETVIDAIAIRSKQRLFFFSVRQSRSALRQHISKIQIFRFRFRREQLYYKTERNRIYRRYASDRFYRRSISESPIDSCSAEEAVGSPAWLFVCAGTRRVQIGKALSLEAVEIDWLARELSQFLKIPIS